MKKAPKKRTRGDECLAKVDLALCAAIATQVCVQDVAKLTTLGGAPAIPGAIAEAINFCDHMVEQLHDARGELTGAMAAAKIPFTPRRQPSNLAGRRTRAPAAGRGKARGR